MLSCRPISSCRPLAESGAEPGARSDLGAWLVNPWLFRHAKLVSP